MGHLVLAGLVSRLPAWIADRIMTSATLVGLAAATLWLRWRVAGDKGLVLAALPVRSAGHESRVATGLHELLARVLLVPDHARRLVGGTLPAVSRAHRGPLGSALRRILLPSGEPGADGGRIGRSVGGRPGAGGKRGSWKYRMSRLVRTSISFVPLLVLGVSSICKRQGGSGPIRPVWENLSNPWSPAAWGARLGWVDPITLAVKDGMPFTSRVGLGLRCFRSRCSG